MNSPSSVNPDKEWEEMAKAWVSTLPDGKALSPDEIQAWLQSNQAHLPDHIKSIPLRQLLQRFANFHSTITQPTQVLTYAHKFAYFYQLIYINVHPNCCFFMGKS